MGKVFVDTSGWVSLFVKRDKQHKKAVTVFEMLKRQKMFIYTSDYIIDETITIISSRSNHHQSVIAGDALFSSKIIKIINVAPEYIGSAWTMYKKYRDKEFSFTDVTSFVIMKRLSIKNAFGFDNDFLQVGVELI